MSESATAAAPEAAPAVPVRVLIVDDEPEKLGYVRALLEAHACTVEVEPNGSQALARVKRDPVPDLVLLDLMMPGQDGIATLGKLRRARPALRVVMLSNLNDTRKAVEAAQLGAADYLTKPLKEADLKSLLGQAALAGSASGAPPAAPETDGEDTRYVMVSPAMQRVRAEALRVAPIDVPVLILGESGTGKEVVARLIHRHSRRADGPFVKVNCAALPGELLESELFGYEAGAFTGAVQAQLGRIHAAHRGTLFLDEIGELPLAVQAKLLRFVQEGEVQRLGSPDVFRVDVRLLAATNADLERRVEEGRFRADLFYRLSVFPLELPPLRQRPEDVVELAQDLLDGLARRTGAGGKALSPRAAQCLAEYPWPGNVRQLQHALERAMILADGGRDIQPEHLPAALHRFAAAEAAGAALRRPPRSANSEIANRTWGGIGNQAAWA